RALCFQGRILPYTPSPPFRGAQSICAMCKHWFSLTGMIHLKGLRIWTVVLTLISCAVSGHAQLNVEGIDDRGTYNQTVSFRVPTAPGFTYLVLLNGQPVPTDITQVVNSADYHEVFVSRTNAATL